MKRLLFLFIIFCFTSCSNNGDKFIGDWVNKYDYIKITKAGEYYFIVRFINNSTYKDYCIFEKGCFKFNDNQKAILACTDNHSNITYNGISFKKN